MLFSQLSIHTRLSSSAHIGVRCFADLGVLCRASFPGSVSAASCLLNAQVAAGKGSGVW